MASKKGRKKEREFDPFIFGVEGETINIEKAKARKLRQSSWWKRKIADGICYYCKETFKPDELTMDHKIPLSRGGLTEKINIVSACKECNNKKKYMLPTEWDEYLKKIQ